MKTIVPFTSITPVWIKLWAKATRRAMIILLTLCAFSAQGQTVPEWMYFHFDQVAGAATPNDAPASTRVGTATAPVSGLTIGGVGQFSAGLVGTGAASSTNFVNTGWATNFTGSWTMSMWLNIPNQTATRYYLGDLNAGSLRCFTGGAAGTGIRITGPITFDIPNIHPGPIVIHWVYDASTGVLSGYKNGVFSNSASFPGLTMTGAGPFYVGAYSATNGSVEGVLDEFRLYNRALTTTEIGITWNKRLPIVTGPNNASAAEITEPVNFCQGTLPVKVKVKNTGNNLISNLKVNWQLDGVGQPQINLTTPIDTFGSVLGNELIVTLGNVAFTNVGRTVRAWTSLPNGVTDTSNGDDTVAVTLQAALNGTYTIGGAAPNYPSISAAAAALNSYGVCGPVTFNIRNGTYTNDQANLNAISGTSAINRITFKSETNNAANVIFNDNNSTTAGNYIFNLNGSSYVTIKDLTLNPTNASFGRAVVISGGSYDSVVRCAMTLTAGTTSSVDRSAICNIGATNTANVFLNNTIVNPSYGIYQYGVNTTSLADSNVIDGNTITNAYSYGIYAYYNKNLKVRNNTLTRAAQTATGIYYGILSYYADDASEMTGNKVTVETSAGTAYGIAQLYNDGTSLASGKTINNVIRITGGATVYGLAHQYSSNTYVLNNTVVVSSAGATCYAGYIYYSAATYANNNVNNNIFWNSGTTGAACYNYNTNFSTVDYNTVFGGANLFQRGTPALTTNSLSAWRIATANDLNTICYSPGLTSATNLLPNPADPASWAIQGRGIQHTINATDINGNPRPATLATGVPDVGAYEFVPTSVPPAAVATPAVALPGASQAFTFGQDTIAILDWAAASTVPTALTVSVRSGVVPGALPAGSFMYYYTDVAATGAGLSYTANSFYKDPWKGTSPANESAIRMASKNGAAAWVSYPGAASTIDINRNVLTVPGMTTGNWYTGRVDNCTGVPGPLSITNPVMLGSLCSGQNVFLNATDPNLFGGIVYRWQSAPTATGPWTDIPGATSLSYTSGPLTDTTYYRVVDTCTPSNQGAVSNVYVVPVANPLVLNSINGVRCGPGTIQLQATGSTASTLTWYNVATGGIAIGTGTTFTTSNQISGTITYYVEANIGACRSARTPVTATVTAGPMLTVTDTLKLCNDQIGTLTVTSPQSNFDSYIWSPITDLYLDAAATSAYNGTNAATVYVKSTTSNLVRYAVQGLNTTTQCTGMDTTDVYIMPAAATIAATPDTICVSGTTTLALAPNATYAPGVTSWFSSQNGTTFNQISGASGITYTSGTIASDTFFRAVVRNGNNTICLDDTIFIYRNNPAIVSTTGATRCGPGTVQLQATGSANATSLNWYTTPTGGSSVGSGSPFTTPILTATTNYYVSAGNGSGGGSGVDSLQTILGGGNGCNGGVMFDITPTTNVTIDSFLARFQTAGAQTAIVYYKVGTYAGFETNAAAWTTLGTSPAINATANGLHYINPGTSLPLTANTTYGIYLYYYASYTDGVGTYTNADMTLNAGSGLCLQYGSVAGTRIFNGRVLYHKGAGCESPRTLVTATVTPSAAFSVTDTQSVCNNGIATLSVLSPSANYGQVTWTPVTNLYSDAAATIPYVANTNASTVYARTATPGFTSYIATGFNASNNCQGMDTSVIFTQALITNVTASPDTICNSGSSTLTVIPASPFYPNSLSWLNSTDNNVTYNPIAGATANTYTTPVITDTTWYRIRTRNTAGATCQDFDKALIVKIPTLTSVTPGVRCGVGPVTLSATNLAGYQPNWYTAATGGQPVATGNTFVTPTLFNTTTYYVAAGSGGGGTGTVGPLNPQVVGTNANTTTTYNVLFTVNVPTTLLSVDIFPGTAAIGTASSLQLWSNGATPAQLQTVNFTTTVTGGATPQTIPLNFILAPGNYYLRPGTSLNLQRNSAGVVYPYTSPAINITGNTFLASYYVHYYNWKYSSGCGGPRVPVTATVNPAPPVTIVPNDTAEICFGDVATFTATSANAGYKYTWNPVQVPGATLNIQPNVSASYFLAALDTTNASTGGCTFYDTVYARVNPTPAADAIPLGSTFLCAGDSVRLATPAGAGYTYQWIKNNNDILGATDTSFLATSQGAYSVRVTLGNCVVNSQAEIVTVHPLPTPSITANGAILTTGSYQAYQWIRNGQTIFGATGQSYLPTQNGDYEVSVTDMNGCSNTSSVFRLSSLGVNAVNVLGGDVKIHPNPVSTKLIITAPVKIKAVLTTMDGRVVLKQDNVKEIDVTSIADGVYFLRVYDMKDGAILKTEKLLKAAE